MHKCLKLNQRSSVVPTNKKFTYNYVHFMYIIIYTGGGGGEGMHDRRSTAVPIAPLNTVHYLG